MAAPCEGDVAAGDSLVLSENETEEVICCICGVQFATDAQLETHERITASCLNTPGKCYFYKHCKFETEDIDELRRHLQRDADLHLQAIMLRFDGDVSQADRARRCEKVRKVSGLGFAIQADAAKKRLEHAQSTDTLLSEAIEVVGDNSTRIESLTEAIAEISKMASESKSDAFPSLSIMKREVNHSAERLERIHKTFQEYQKGCQGGAYLWVIDNYSTKKQAEVDGSALCQVSSPFNTHEQGYKVQALAYLNGFGEAKGNHLSLFLRIVDGDYDDVLEFPFNKNVNFVLHNKPYTGERISKTCRPDSTKRYALRNPNNWRMSFGIIKFAEIEKVESETHMINNKLYLDFKVCTDGSIDGSTDGSTDGSIGGITEGSNAAEVLAADENACLSGDLCA